MSKAEELMKLEPQARTLCELRGIDPDEFLNREPGTIVGPRMWHAAANELVEFMQCLVALKMHTAEPVKKLDS